MPSGPSLVGSRESESPVLPASKRRPAREPVALPLELVDEPAERSPVAEAEPDDELPSPDGWQYEPKWDGFRGVLENLGGGLRLWSRNARPLLRYFPELEDVGVRLPPDSALDGEIIIGQDGRLDFDALQLRLHPAESRIRKLSAEIPSDYIAFDVLVWKGEPLHKLPLEKRRRELERKAKRFRLSPVSRERE